MCGGGGISHSVHFSSQNSSNVNDMQDMAVGTHWGVLYKWNCLIMVTCMPAQPCIILQAEAGKSIFPKSNSGFRDGTILRNLVLAHCKGWRTDKE